MGLYDRGYVRNPYGEESSIHLAFGKPMVTLIIVFTSAVYLLDFLTSFKAINELFSLRTDAQLNPLYWYQLLTYGFVHSPTSLGHIVFNMLGLFFLGTAVEQQIGRKEFLRFYLASIIVGGIAGTLWAFVRQHPASIVGASGGVQAVVMLFILMNPRAVLQLYFFIPVQAWVLGVILLLSNIFFYKEGTAVEVHLGGIAFAAAYYFLRWDLSKLSPRNWSLSKILPNRSPQLRVHDPDDRINDEAEEADRILQKIHERGEASLSARERKTLERYSRRMRERQQRQNH